MCMTREEFSEKLRKKISGLPEDEIEGRVSFYNEIIDDRMEEGMSEEDAVESIGSVDSVADQIMAEIPFSKLIEHKVNQSNAGSEGKKRNTGRVITLIALFPVWIILFALILALYIVLWALVLSLYIVVIAFALVSLSGIPGTVYMFVQGRNPEALLVLGAAIFLAGLAIALVVASVAATRGTVRLMKRIALGVKSIFVGKMKAPVLKEGGAQA